MTNNHKSYDLYTTFPIVEGQERKTIQHIASNKDLDIATRIRLLVIALPFKWKERDRKGRERDTNGKDVAFEEYKPFVLAPSGESSFASSFQQQKDDYMQSLGLWQPATPDFTLLPPYSAFLQFTFELTKPYISRDDELFHISDNPIRKDKVFKVPMVAATGWKGNLRWTARQLEPELDQQTMNRLFGPEKEDEDSHLAGRLHFYPTFFDRISLEVINPHDRATRAGKYPIYFESVPTGTEGIFSLLYVPLPGSIHSEQEARADLRIVTSALYQMLCIYGFSAKKSSGFGEVADEVRDTNLSTIGRSVTFGRLSELESKVRYVVW